MSISKSVFIIIDAFNSLITKKKKKVHNCIYDNRREALTYAVKRRNAIQVVFHVKLICNILSYGVH